MKIELRSLHVKGCGPLEDVTIDFTDADGKPRPVTVLAGANGSGKTTVLELICGIFDSVHLKQALDTKKTYFKEHPINSFILSKSILKSEEVTLFAEIDSLNLEFSLRNKRIQFSPKEKTAWSILVQKNGENYGVNTFSGNQLLIDSILKQEGQAISEFLDQANIIPSILYFPHPRKIFSTQGEFLSKEEVIHHWVYRYENAQDFQGSLDAYLCWLAFIEPERPGVFSEVTKFLNLLDFDGKKFDLKRTKLKATVTTREGHTHFLEELSAGEQNILIMLLELRRRLLPGSIVLIDEIESSLHEAYQHFLARSLLKLQREIPFQLVVTTHSKAIAKIFGWESTVILTNW